MNTSKIRTSAQLLLTCSLAAMLAACGADRPAFSPERVGTLGEPAGSCPAPSASINFQPGGAPVPAGFTPDDGSAYSAARGFGWVREDSLAGTRVPLDLRANTRDRNRPGIDQKLDTLIHLQYSGSAGVTTPGAWEYNLPNGRYCVTVSVGDAPYDSAHTINLEGVRVIDRFVPTSAQEYRSASALVDVADGRLTVDARGGSNTKLNYLLIAPASAGNVPSLKLENLDGAPYPDRLAFNRISTANFPGYGVHNLASLRLSNTGSAPLQVQSLRFSGPWALASALSLPATVPAGASLDLPIRFTATSGDGVQGSLTIGSNDPAMPSATVQLAGFWQSMSEGGQEPSVQELLDVFGYKTKLLYTGQKLANKGQVEAVGEEVLSPFWRRVDSSRPVTVRQLAAFHTQNQANTARWYLQGSATLGFITTQKAGDAQSVLPRRYGSDTEPAAGSFSPSGVFGFKIETEWSEDSRNDMSYDHKYGCTSNCGHHVRFWPVRDRSGLTEPDTYLMVEDSLGVNYDYNDNVYLVSNVRPAGQ